MSAVASLTAAPPAVASAPDWHADLVAFLPLVRARAGRAFAALSQSDRDEAVADVTADVAVGLAGLADRGRAHFRFIPPLVAFGVRRHRAGRRVGTPTAKRDLLSPVPRAEPRARGLEAGPDGDGVSWRNAVADSRRTDPAEAAAFRVDFAAWLGTLDARDRDLALALAEGERPCELARRHRISPSRMSQIRSRLRAAWAAFVGDDTVAA